MPVMSPPSMLRSSVQEYVSLDQDWSDGGQEVSIHPTLMAAGGTNVDVAADGRTNVFVAVAGARDRDVGVALKVVDGPGEVGIASASARSSVLRTAMLPPTLPPTVAATTNKASTTRIQKFRRRRPSTVLGARGET